MNEEVEKVMNEALLQEFQEEMSRLQSKLLRDTKWGFIILGCIIALKWIVDALLGGVCL